MPPGQIVLDLETKRTFEEAGGRNPADLGITVVGTYFYETDEYRIFEEGEIPDLEQSLSQATRVIGFNNNRFKRRMVIVNVDALNDFADGEEVGLEAGKMEARELLEQPPQKV